MGFTVAEGKIAEIDSIADPERVRGFTTAVLPEVAANTARGGDGTTAHPVKAGWEPARP